MKISEITKLTRFKKKNYQYDTPGVQKNKLPPL